MRTAKKKPAVKKSLVWRSRIVGHGKLDPRSIIQNPANYKAHPDHQRESLSQVIAGLGFIRSVTISKRTGTLLDGHLRVALAIEEHQPSIDVEYVDLTVAEERAALAVIDPLATLAEYDDSALADLVSDIELPDVEKIINEIAGLDVELDAAGPTRTQKSLKSTAIKIAVGAYTVFAFDVSPSRRNCSLVAGQILPDGRIGIGIMETWSSQVAVDDLKIAAAIKGWCDLYRPRLVCYDKYATQSIADRLKQAGVMTEDVSGQQFYQACGDLLTGLVTHKVVHNGQAELIQQMNNCAAKVNDSAWRIIKRKSAGDISAPIGLAMVVSKLMLPAPKPQIVT